MKSIIIFTVFILTFQCSKKQEEDVKAVISNKWVLENLIGFEHSIEGGKGKPTIEINIQDLTYSGYAGCNHYNGKINYAKASIKLMPALMTKMACNDKGLERAFLIALDSFNSYKLENEKLKRFKEDKLIAVFIIKE